jgi:hypothetical protein
MLPLRVLTPGSSSVFLVFATLVLAASGGDARSVAHPVQQSGLVLSIGASGGDSTLEFFRASSALLLPNGEVVVANNGTSQLRWFRADGSYLRTVGRRGNGPQEFRRTVYLYEGVADTLVAYDEGNRRFHYISHSGTTARMDTLGDRDRPFFIYDRVLVERIPTGVERERLRAITLGMPRDETRFPTRVIPDRQGNLWAREPGDTGHWTGYGIAGRRVGVVTLPAGFEPYQILDTLVLGRMRDSVGVEQIQLRHFRRTAAAATSSPVAPRTRYSSEAEMSDRQGYGVALRSAYRNIVTAQEAYFADNGKYSPSIERLAYRPTNGVQVIVEPSADGSFYRMVAWHPEIRTVCVMGFGDEWPMREIMGCG